MDRLDPHQRPPEEIRRLYKKCQKFKPPEVPLHLDQAIVDLSLDPHVSSGSKVHIVRHLDNQILTSAFRAFAAEDAYYCDSEPGLTTPVYEHEDMPGLHIIPSLLPPEIQQILLSRLLHRHLSDPSHLTNVHTHYSVSYPPSRASFFSTHPSSRDSVAIPIDPTVHKPLIISQFLNKKLRWTTLGGQYDWTEKRYPDAVPPEFPPDIKVLLQDIFPETRPEAAIVNLYSPGDTLSVHRDVAEASATGLVSLSLGCDAIFVIGTSAQGHDQGHERVLALRLRSGSAVYMSGTSRFAWHGVPQIVPGTCPDHLQNWPGSVHGQGDYEQWKGWMMSKRVNLNIRQMRD